MRILRSRLAAFKGRRRIFASNFFTSRWSSAGPHAILRRALERKNLLIAEATREGT
jgi:hypothetical protein